MSATAGCTPSAERLAEQLTSDDSWAAVMLARDPSLDPAVLEAHPMRNALTSVVGPGRRWTCMWASAR